MNENLMKNIDDTKCRQYDLKLYREEIIYKFRNGFIEPDFRVLSIYEKIYDESQQPLSFKSGIISRLNVDLETRMLWLNGKPTFVFLPADWYKRFATNNLYCHLKKIIV